VARRRSAGVCIREHLDVFEARWSVQRVAVDVGFSSRDAGELVLVASELATNILKFAPPGEIEAARIENHEHGLGIRITASDCGAPLHDLDRILATSTLVGVAREWTGRGLGGGLGAVVRFTDALICLPGKSGGKQLVADRYLRRLRRR
jgi:anti-sigma regulatory factor (Ser/Thr protein kinase)